ncbi:MAG: hypothetical protein Q9167_006280 [Letrouitia subvulpina]
MQRRSEINAKRAKLAELRKQREEREQRQKELAKKNPTREGTPDSAAPIPSRPLDRKEFDIFINDLVGEHRSSAASPAGTSSPSTRKSRPSSTFIPSETRVEAASTAPQDAPSSQSTPAVPQNLSTAPVTVNYSFSPTSIQQVPERISYSKGIQTSEQGEFQRKKKSEEQLSSSDSDRLRSPARSPRKLKRLSRREREREEELRRNLRQEIEEELRAVKESAPSSISLQAKYPARTLTNEELNAVTGSEDFLDFVERSSKVIERALDEEYDVLADYAPDGQEADDDEEEGYGRSKGKKGRRIRQVAEFYDDRWCKKRMISDLEFSPKFPELLLSSYTKNPSVPADPSGILKVWNLHLRSRAEYTFHSTSDILTAHFSPFHPSLIFGGTYSGQVLLWDTRSRSPLPSQKTPLTGASTGGHTHPVYSLALVGTQNAHNIISTSTDGVVCTWTADMLSHPQEYLELTTPPPSKIEDLSPTCMVFPPSDPTSFLVGTEEGTIYPCHRYDRAGAKAGTDTRVRYRSHTAPVTSLDFHPARGPIDLSDLALSTGLDWTVKLWKTRPASSSSAVAVASSTSSSTAAASDIEAIQPVLSLPRDDLVYDAKWSPVKPGVFSLVDGVGSVEVWDLSVDMETPVSKAKPETAAKKVGVPTGFAAQSLNKVAWEGEEGKRIGVGGAAGVVSVFEVGSELSGESVRNEEWVDLKRAVGRAERARRRG